MGLPAENSGFITKEEYYKLADESLEKLEYHNGALVAMAGGTSEHSLVATRIGRLLDERLDGKNCYVYNSDMAVFVEKFNLFLYPDASVVCGPRQFEDEGRRRLLNPSLIIEVLSESTETYDRSDKFAYYRSLPSFKEYILLSSTKIWVESYFREDKDLWRIFSAGRKDAMLPIRSLDLEIKVADIYAKTEDLKEILVAAN